jgi:hypothetical protein
VRDVGLVAVTLLSLKITAPRCTQTNQFAWGPMQEVAKLFAGIFLTIIPVIAMLRAARRGRSAPSRPSRAPTASPIRRCTSGPRAC